MAFASGLAVGIWLATAVCAGFARREFAAFRREREQKVHALELELASERAMVADLRAKPAPRTDPKKKESDEGSYAEGVLLRRVHDLRKLDPEKAKRYGFD